ncbi:MAG: preprotein translocase subunit SecA [Clostridiales bacterium GWF2_38_85]|nr:MAG: preprotein translocase subunit SecA [Clostridiales bacterium GWF2_38_85]HBL85502.1 preprotein translocase subunit SecA [Clostridiales bacterium]
MGLIQKIFGSYSDHQVKKLKVIADKIEALSEKYAAMDETTLIQQTEILKSRLTNGETLNDILPDAFAVVREASTRVLGKRHYYCQLLGGIVIHQGRIAEMRTGEGKTLVATLPAYLNALAGNGVHIITVNDYLAKRDSEWMGNIYRYLGMSVGLIVNGLTPDERRIAYNADITYGTNNEFGFDYLRDNMVIYKESMVQRGHNFAIVDEVDSILIDEARTPLIISGQAEESTPLYGQADNFVKHLRLFKIKELDAKEHHDNIDADYIVDEKARTAVFTTQGIKKAESAFHVENLADPENATLMHHLTNAIRARGVMQTDVDYVIKDGEVFIVDAFTGRIMVGRRYSDGLHQAIEAKEGVNIRRESKTFATITFQNYFRMYKKLSGMTGTALTEEDEFREIYSLDVVVIPTNKPMIRLDQNDLVYRNQAGKYKAIIEQINECKKKGQPVLVGTVSIEKSEYLSKLLIKQDIKHTVLNAKYHDKEAEIIAQAGMFGSVTISTNMAGRGTDIMLGGNSEYLAKSKLRAEGMDEHMIFEASGYGQNDDADIITARVRYKELFEKYEAEIKIEAEKVKAAGGLFILGTERHESRRIDNQLRGRAGRQGDPGESRFFLSLEDDLMRLFGSERIGSLVEKLGLPEDQPIDAKMLSNSIETAQKRLEGTNFERRKNVLSYDDVMNQQRTLIYKQRRDVLDGANLKDKILDMIDFYVTSGLDLYAASELPDDWNTDALRGYYYGVLTTDDDFKYTREERDTISRESVHDMLFERAKERYAQKEELFTSERMREIERIILLRNVDRRWIDHIDAMDDLVSGIGLRAYAQHNPITEYKIEGSNMFEEMSASIKIETARMVMTVVSKDRMERSQVMKVSTATQGPKGEKVVKAPTRKKEKIGVNDPCPCGSGLKYKKCCMGKDINKN